MKEQTTGRSRGFGFITFAQPSEAEEAIQRMNNQPLVRPHRRRPLSAPEEVPGSRSDCSRSQFYACTFRNGRFSCTVSVQIWFGLAVSTVFALSLLPVQRWSDGFGTFSSLFLSFISFSSFLSLIWVFCLCGVSFSS